MSVDELLRAFSAFDNGVKNFATTSAINEATEKVNQITAAQQDEMEKRQALNGVANSLALRLSGIGADPARVAQATGAVRPEAISSPFDAFRVGQETGDKGMQQFATQASDFSVAPQMKLQGDQQAFQGRENALNRAHQERIASMKAERKLTDAELGIIMKGQEKLNTDAKKYFEAVEQAQTAIDMLDSKNPLADNAVATFMARATGEVGNLTEAERKPFGSSKDVVARLKQIGSEIATGKITPSNRAYIKKLATTFKESNSRAVESYAGRKARQISAATGLDYNEVKGKLLPPLEPVNKAAAAAPQDAAVTPNAPAADDNWMSFVKPKGK